MPDMEKMRKAADAELHRRYLVSDQQDQIPVGVDTPSGHVIDPEPEQRKPAATFTVRGVFRTNQAELKSDPAQQCLCCRPRGHVFGWGIDLPGTEAGTQGPIPLRPETWMHRILGQYRFEPGRKVRLTLEILADDSAFYDARNHDAHNGGK